MIYIVTVTFNNFEELRKTISSISNLSGIKSIVINGGTCSVTRDFLAKNPGIISISEPDDGIADAFNKGIDLISDGSSPVMFLNSGDELINPTYLEWAQKKFQSEPDLDFTTSPINISLDYEVITAHPRFITGYNWMWGMPFPHPGLIVRRKIITEVGGFDKSFRIAMDTDLMARVMTTLPKLPVFTAFKSPSVLMEGTGVSQSNARLALQEDLRVIKKNRLIGPLTFPIFSYRISSYIAKRLLPYRLVKYLRSKCNFLGSIRDCSSKVRTHE